jgi:predicted aspartyl protease
MEFGELTWQKLRADAVNLGHIENRRGVKILGLVGFSMMKNLEIVINAENNELRLFKLDKEGNRISRTSAVLKTDHTQKIEGNGNILFLKGSVAGKTLNFCFDTGAETNTISSNAGKNILSTLTITRRMELKGAGAAKSEVLFGRMNDFSLGDKRIDGMETIVTSLYAMSEAYDTRIDGMLGFSFLEQGTVSINFVKKQFGFQFTKGGGK